LGVCSVTDAEQNGVLLGLSPAATVRLARAAARVGRGALGKRRRRGPAATVVEAAAATESRIESVGRPAGNLRVGWWPRRAVRRITPWSPLHAHEVHTRESYTRFSGWFLPDNGSLFFFFLRAVRV